MKPLVLLASAVVLIALASAAGAPPSGPASLPASLPTVAAGDFFDSLHGFSLTPPAGTERIRQSTGRRIVSWVKREEKTQAVLWELEVLFTTHPPTSLPAAEYAALLADEFAKAGQYAIESKSVGSIAGKDCMTFKGVWTSAPGVARWRIQTWVQTAPRENLILSVTGPMTGKDELEKTLANALATLRLYDVEKLLEARREGLKRGTALLTGLTEKKLEAMLSPEPAFYSVQLSGKSVGFVKVSEALTVRDRVPGLRVVRDGALKIPGEPRRLTHEDLFATPDRAGEWWKRVFLEGEGASAVRSVQEGEKQGTLLRTRTTQGKLKPRTDQRDIPDVVRESYLPAAFDSLAVRLLDRSAPASCGLTTYNPASNDFDLRTIRVVGQESITLGGKATPAARLSDQIGVDAPPVDVWVDAKGAVLRMEMPGGLVLERSDQKGIVSAYSAEIIELEKLGS